MIAGERDFRLVGGAQLVHGGLGITERVWRHFDGTLENVIAIRFVPEDLDHDGAVLHMMEKTWKNQIAVAEERHVDFKGMPIAVRNFGFVHRHKPVLFVLVEDLHEAALRETHSRKLALDDTVIGSELFALDGDHATVLLVQLQRQRGRRFLVHDFREYRFRTSDQILLGQLNLGVNDRT